MPLRAPVVPLFEARPSKWDPDCWKAIVVFRGISGWMRTLVRVGGATLLWVTPAQGLRASQVATCASFAKTSVPAAVWRRAGGHPEFLRACPRLCTYSSINSAKAPEARQRTSTKQNSEDRFAREKVVL